MTPKQRRRIELRLKQRETELVALDDLIESIERSYGLYARETRRTRDVIKRLVRLYRHTLTQDEQQVRLPL